ncbi:MAG: type II toxin-antitoxin system RelE/ParE family toxin [Streptococcus gallolyticus]|nr:type II toxin-antitoxin system RelE/ParE family toxin [Streptococcus gallolyticus]
MFKLVYTENFLRSIRKLDKQTQRLIKNWICKNLLNTADPYSKGKTLKGKLKGIWRYRVGDYRLFATIEDDKLVIFMFDVGHRRDIYKKLNKKK